MNVLNAARKAVPAVDYALGAAGVAAAGALVVGYLGNGRAAVIIMGGMLVAMILLFLFARLLATRNKAVIQAAIALMWMVVIFVGVFLFFTTTAFAIQWPTAWAEFLGIEREKPFDRKAMAKLLEVPKDISSQISKKDFHPPLELVRLQPRSNRSVPPYDIRDTVLRGGGAYYSFVSRTHEYGSGSDIEVEPGHFKVGFAGADYGFFMYLGDRTPDELAAFKLDALPNGLDSSRLEAWRYMWNYRPPTDNKAVRQEGIRTRGFAVGSVTLSDRISINKGGAYLLRSISIDRSDVLVGFIVADILSDNSVVLVWRTLQTFDTPIATGREY